MPKTRHDVTDRAPYHPLPKQSLSPSSRCTTTISTDAQEQQRELKKAKKDAAKAAEKTADAGDSTGSAPAAAAPPASTAKGMPAATAAAAPGGAAEASVQFCAAMPPTVAFAACSLTQTKLAFAAGEVSCLEGRTGMLCFKTERRGACG